MTNASQYFQLLLWDIDGTLVQSGGSRVDNHLKAVEVFLKKRIDVHQQIAGKTDAQIVAQLLCKNGAKPSEVDIAEVLLILDTLSTQELKDRPVSGVAGVAKALELASNAGWSNGLLTGNTQIRARAKLEPVGIWALINHDFTFFGHEAKTRSSLVATSIMSIQATGRTNVVLVGDTPLDIESARENHLQIIAVSTGQYLESDLMSLKPDLLITDWRPGLQTFSRFIRSFNS